MLVGRNKSMIFFLSSASAQVFADVALCPFESIKVRVQTQSNFGKGLVDGFPKVYRTEGFSGYFSQNLIVALLQYPRFVFLYPLCRFTFADTWFL